MRLLRKLVLAVLVVLPLGVYAQDHQQNTSKQQPEQQTSTSEPIGSSVKQTSSPAKRVLREVAHGANPITWVRYLAQPGVPCTLAYWEAYGVCQGDTAKTK